MIFKSSRLAAERNPGFPSIAVSQIARFYAIGNCSFTGVSDGLHESELFCNIEIPATVYQMIGDPMHSNS